MTKDLHGPFDISRSPKEQPLNRVEESTITWVFDLERDKNKAHDPYAGPEKLWMVAGREDEKTSGDRSKDDEEIDRIDRAAPEKDASE